MYRGQLITFEGGEGSGKTTQIRLLEEELKRMGISVLVSREPGGTVLGERIREILLDPNSREEMGEWTELFLFSAARREHVRQVVKPALEEGRVVLLDRFVDSSRAYQGFGDGNRLSAVTLLTSFALDGVVPDLTILLDVPFQIGLGRKQLREWNRMEDKEQDYHERALLGFRRMAELEPDRWRVVDANRPTEAVWKEVKDLSLRFLGLRRSIEGGGKERER